MRTTLNIQDPLVISAPNGGGLLYAHRHLLMPLSQEDTTGLSITADGMLWCLQADGSRSLREIRQGQLRTRAVAPTPLDLHDILWRPDGIYAVFTETNQVVRLDAAFQVQEHWSFGDAPDSAHVNCLAWHDGRLLVSMFGTFAMHRGYKGATRQAGRVVDVRSGQVLIEGLSQPHSLVSVGEQLWLCSSEDRSVCIHDRHFKLERRVQLPGYTRGLAVGEHAVYVGISRSRNLQSADAGEFASAVISVLDRQSLELIGHVPLPWNEVYDIRIVRSTDVVTDVMASVWALERTQNLKIAEETKQSAANELAAMMRTGKASAERADSLQSQLTAARGEIMKRDARIHELERVREELALVMSSRSWRWTKLLRFITRTIQHRGLSIEDRRKLLRLPPEHVAANAAQPNSPSVSTSASQAGRSLAEVTLAGQQHGRRDFFVWAVIDWHFRIQRPQHLARELARLGHRVFYISVNFVDRAEPGFWVEPLDEDGRLFQIRLHLHGSPAIYHAAPDAIAQAQLRASVGRLLTWTRSRACASLVQHPYWTETAQILPNHRLVYDCMDHHGGFAGNGDDVLAREHELMRDADLLVVTSEWLDTEAGKYNSHRMLIRNACQYEHFSQHPAQAFNDPAGRKIIGYYGAIAEWFDLDLVEQVAGRFCDCLVLLVGADTCGAQQRLQHLRNVQFTGEVSYATLPRYLESFDVCLLPFQVVPLTLATNPVKVYEYLSAGKDVVSIDLPEIRQFGDLVRIGSDHLTFIAAVEQALRSEPDPAEIVRRQEFAAGQTWVHRVQDLVGGIEALSEPRVSVVVVTYNNLELTRICLDSLVRYSDYRNLEVIVVDNASSDDTPAFLTEWAAGGGDRRIILNEDNRGFAAANNQGLALATGEYLVMLNNDTHVTPGWVATLVGHLRRAPKLGMLGPVTNNIGNEARIDIHYDDMDQMLQRAADYTGIHAGQLTPLHTAAFFCVMMPRRVYEKVGALDEAFGIGMFEDDDYCRRVQQAGWSIACADDVFIHHNLSASFNKIRQATRQAMFEKNKAIYEAKWGAWIAHRYRSQ